MTQHKQDANFIWADLSALNLDTAKGFYSNVFGWHLSKETSVSEPFDTSKDAFGMAKTTYYTALRGTKPVAGIFDMPEFFVKINMPSFWMSYLAVDDIDAVVARARQIKHVIIEVEPTPFGDGRMALIRDPAGAGFTVFEGTLGKRGDGTRQGEVVWNELIVDSVKKVRPFYEKVFGFSLKKDASFADTRYSVHNPAGEEIAGIQEVDATLRGNKVYWVPFFAVGNLDTFTQRVEQHGGAIEYRADSPQGEIALVYDAQTAAFGVIETGATHVNLGRYKIRTAIALIALWLAALMNWHWVWGLALLAWVYPDIRSGNTFLVESLSRKDNPFWYWAVIVTWIAMALGLILMSIT